ncbi:MAG TPA: thioredoxin [Firmicutes bacterium]|nr:thioredoxin [Bacillota bacterium]
MSGNVQEIAGGDFSTAVLKAQDPVLVDFWATWCGPCKMLAPVLEEIAAELEGRLKMVKVNVEENRELVGQFRIMSVPTLVLLKDGKELTRLTGYLPKEELLDKLESFL